MQKPLTIGRLHKLLGKLIDEGHGRRRVSVSKATFHSNLEQDGCTIIDAYDCRLTLVNIADDDGASDEGRGCRVRVPAAASAANLNG